ncbi:fimbrial protein FimV [Rhodoferax lacus]|uniref:Fimbrial protein FimV n=1 Tax=Rhodoferax lacus TaxID=2184758 RepID=A0A3E1RCH0_9BURK|nr:fimbrial protein FimV [Rhodoferax lacus]
MEKSHRWHRTAIAAAAVALLSLHASEVFALSLGRITVLSALGEPLKAEIEVPNISAEEAASLKANVASPAAFTAAGLEYNPAMSGLQATLARRSDGRAYIRLSSDRAINEPFVDMILEASWSSGRIVRDYTMLFDPASLKQVAVAPTLPQTNTAAPVSVPAKVAAAPVAAQATESAPVASKPAPVAVAAKAPPAAATGTQQVKVVAGDSASKLALRNKTSDVSLDQMLVALLRANPDAFAKGNLNRLRAGALVDLPTSEQAKSVPAAEAAQTVLAQSKDFNEFRRSLADNAPKTAVEATNRKAAGSVDAKVEDKKAASNAADKLTLSKGALQAKTDEAKIAKERAEKDAATRAAELAKNIADLNKLSAASAASAPKAAPAVAAAASQPAPAVVAPKVEVAQAPATVPVASAPVAAPAPPASAASAPAKPTLPVAAPVAESSLVDDLMEDPTLPLAGGGLLALLGGFALYRRQQNKKRASHVDSSFLESRLQPDSFFGASGGQRVDTAQDASNGNSSLSYTSSQLGAADDVDPVAEADVYLAYGRDVQAEEILKEAVRHNPERLAIHSKLLDVYAKRRDAANFMASANTAFQLVGADSPEWSRICELGLTIDPQNPLYQPGGATLSAFGSLEPTTDSAALGGDSTVLNSALPEMQEAGSDLDLDLDFSAEEAAASAAAPLTDYAAQETVKMAEQDMPISNTLDFDISGPGDLEPTASVAPAAADELSTQFDFPQALPDLSFAEDGLSLNPPGDPDPIAMAVAAASTMEAKEEAPANIDEGMLEFDLGSLSLDLGPSTTSPAEPAEAEAEDSSSYGDNSLETKLALAEEFVSIGDQDGARALIEEVVAEATGDLREKAQRALSKLS